MRVEFNATGLLDKAIMESLVKGHNIAIYDISCELLGKNKPKQGINVIKPTIPVDGLIGMYSVTQYIPNVFDIPGGKTYVVSFTIGKIGDDYREITMEQAISITRNVIIAMKMYKTIITDYFEGTGITLFTDYN